MEKPVQSESFNWKNFWKRKTVSKKNKKNAIKKQVTIFESFRA